MKPKPQSASKPRRVSTFDMGALPWTETGKPGIRQKTVRADREKGRFLGLVAFDPLVTSGLHQHLGPAFSYFLSGSLTDYQGRAAVGQAGINLAGATHDAVSYEGCLLAARLEAPVIYPPEPGPLHQLHVGARHAAIANPCPETPPDINVDVARLPAVPVAAGVSRRLIFDYAGTGFERRFVQLDLLPGASIAVHRCPAPVEWFVLAGDVEIDGERAAAPSFVIIEPDSEVAVSSSFGATLLAWAEGATAWSDGKPRPELYGF